MGGGGENELVENESQRQRGTDKERVRERVHTVMECRKLKGQSLYFKGDSNITRFHVKC